MPAMAPLAKAQPGKINFGTSGSDTPHHLAMTLLQQASGTEFCHVPFNGMGDMITDMLGDHVRVGSAAPGNVTGLTKTGTLRLYAVSAHSRSGWLKFLANQNDL